MGGGEEWGWEEWMMLHSSWIAMLFATPLAIECAEVQEITKSLQKQSISSHMHL